MSAGHQLLITSADGERGMLSAVDSGQLRGRIDLNGAAHCVAVHPRLPLAYIACWGDPVGIVEVLLHEDGSIAVRDGGVPTPAGGARPCSLAIDPRGRFLLVADYDGGVSVLPLDAEGRVEAGASSTVDLPPPRGASGRQDASHPHFVGFRPSDDRVVTVDLGSDRIYELELANDGRCVTVGPLLAVAPVASGPRHAVFASNNRMLVSDELSSSVSLYESEGEGYRHRQSVTSTASATRPNFPSDIALDNRSGFGFVGNRGTDTIGVLRLHDDGLTLVGEYDSGRWPLSLLLADDVLYCASRDEHSVVSWRIARDGVLVERDRTPVPSPTWVARR